MKNIIFLTLFLSAFPVFALSTNTEENTNQTEEKTVTVVTEQAKEAIQTDGKNPTSLTPQSIEVKEITEALVALDKSNLSDGATFLVIWKTIMPDLLKIAANLWSIIAGGLIILIGCPFFYTIAKKSKAVQVHVVYESKTLFGGLFSWQAVTKEELMFSQDNMTDSQITQMALGYIGLCVCTIVGLVAIL